jgi:hypothetical protein
VSFDLSPMILEALAKGWDHGHDDATDGLGKETNPYRRIAASHPPSPATGADNRTTTHATPETGADETGETR